MGHGDEIVLADAHFPGDSMNSHVLRADGLKIVPLLNAILPLFVLDKSFENPLTMMSPSPGDSIDAQIEKAYLQTIRMIWPDAPEINKIERHPFYDRAKRAFVVVMSGDTAPYANIILRKGVTPLQ